MIPPHCAVCGLGLSSSTSVDEFVLIRFKESASGKAFAESGMTGHNPDLVWFCKHHEAMGRKYENLESDEAMKMIGDKKD